MTTRDGGSADASKRVLPAMVQCWDTLSFLHWPYDPAEVQPLLPDGLKVDQIYGRAWMALVPFVLEVRPLGLPAVPRLSRFGEINVRTYVVDRHGRPGIYLFSLDAACLLGVVGARLSYGLRYCWADMTVRVDADTVTYASRRRWPGPAGARCRARVRVKDAIAPGAMTDLEQFLTSRWRLFTMHAGALRCVQARHEPWPLHRTEAVEVDDELMQAAGMPAPSGPPLAHFSPAMTAQLSWPVVVP